MPPVVRKLLQSFGQIIMFNGIGVRIFILLIGLAAAVLTAKILLPFFALNATVFSPHVSLPHRSTGDLLSRASFVSSASFSVCG